ncbi:hypothetical protein [Emticicia agri]|uniref:DUF2383 domain-containing protein n=1 Tax=Emticicia agri TaxID=2492393 RepID=A0A4V1ZDH6_9BACT|nr:hypothetical protein [Emticicia agri]RYU96190.1 hypothetical protein EWM59_08245 [Emticicia agri]
MEKFNEEAMRSLILLREINAVRVKGYQKAVDMIKNGNSKKYFQVQINETNDLTECINRSIAAVHVDRARPNKIEHEKIHQSQFYFTMAASSTNPRTVALSCQLGDKFAEKAYASALTAIQFLSLPELLTLLGKHISSLRKSFESTQEAFDLALVY